MLTTTTIIVIMMIIIIKKLRFGFVTRIVIKGIQERFLRF